MSAETDTSGSFVRRLAGRVTIITGAAGGIGWAAVRRFQAEGAHLFLIDRDADALTEVEATGDPAGTKIIAHVADVTDADAVQAGIEACLDTYGRIDVLYNNAGINATTGPAHSTSTSAWDEIMTVNLRGTFLMCRAALPHLIDTRGAIVNTASTAGVLRASTHSVAYPTSKAGVLALTRSIAAQYGPHGVRANCLVPGVIRTPMSQARATPASRDRYRRAVPVGRPGEPDEVATVATFLASDDASYITGAGIVIDGGWSLLVEYEP